ncbi:MAG TPA: hypothetical protein VM677_09265 [Actinokineospora sp.]|nr:hypothetical protein [Actinokineospora sp.]
MKFRSLLVAAGLATATFLGAATPAQAEVAPSGCTVSSQLGPTATVANSAGTTMISIKQFFGYCGGNARNWSYVYVWQGFYNTGANYSIKTAMITPSGYVWGVPKQRPAREVVSPPTATTTVCTQAFGGIDLLPSGVTYSKTTSQVC